MDPSKNSPSPNQPSAQPKLTPQQELQQVRQQYQAVSEMLWQAIRTLAPESHEVTVLPAASDPLWELSFLRAPGAEGHPDPSGKMRICASTIPEITEAEKKRVVRFLRGTSKPLADALIEFKLGYPMSYIEQKISDRIKWNPGKDKLDESDEFVEPHWESVTPPTAGEKLKNIIHFPK